MAALQEIKKTAAVEMAEKLDEEIRRVDAGIYGEKAVRYELENSHIPMFILHDLYLEHNGLTAQIDYLIVTRRPQFVVECKNLYGNVEITNSGDFIRTVSYGRHVKKEGIYSPITQNRRHLELIKQIRGAEKGNFLTKAIFEKHFYESYRSVVVLANSKTVLNAKYAKKEVREQVIRADQLAEYIRKTDADPKAEAASEKDMELLARFFLDIHKEQKTDYTAKFRNAQESNEEARPIPESQGIEILEAKPESIQQILCPKCGATMIKRKAVKGANARKEFYGCSNYPKCRGIVNVQV
ncbi:MAG: NERD domain-containing protein [Lawsonibacter sp.]|nr:NERD domain-containing protein [Lawsonibacter sp.]